MIPMTAEVAATLLFRYPGARREGLDSMWLSAWSWIEDTVRPQHMLPGRIPSVFESAAILRVAAICAPNAQAKQALRYSAAELVAPYAK